MVESCSDACPVPSSRALSHLAVPGQAGVPAFPQPFPLHSAGGSWERAARWRVPPSAAGLEVTAGSSQGPTAQTVSQGSTGTYSQSSFPRCPWAQGHGGGGHLQRRRGGEQGTWVGGGEGVKGRCTPRGDPGIPRLDTGTPDLWDRVPDTFTSLVGETADHHRTSFGCPGCATVPRAPCPSARLDLARV